MKARVTLAAFAWLAVFCLPAMASAGTLSGRVLTLVPASQLGPTPGGPGDGRLGYREPHPRGLARAKAIADARASAINGRRPGGGGGPTISSYPNVSPSINGAYETDVTPPDTTGAIGPDRYIETINDQYAIYSRSGSLIGSGTLGALTGVTGLFYSVSDPQIMWDPQTQRFYFSAVYYDLFMSDMGLAVGWSTTATPRSAADFCQYAISFGATLPDYEKLGDSPGFVIYGYNKFTNSGTTYTGSEFATLNKPPAGSTCAPTSDFVVTTSGNLPSANGTPVATPVPAKLVDDSSGPGYVIASGDLSSVSSANVISAYSVTTSATPYSGGIPAPSFAVANTVTVPSYSVPASAVQRGSSYRLDTLDGRLENAVAAVDPTRGGEVAIWTAHSVYGGAGAEERWYEINPVAGTLLQSGRVTSPSLYVWNGAISSDRANNNGTATFGGDMAMSVSTSSSSSYPAIQFVTQRAGHAQSSLTNLVQANAPDIDFSCSSTTPCRWGDYSTASPDPAATGTTGKVWLGNQYPVAGGTTSSTSWRTWLFGVVP